MRPAILLTIILCAFLLVACSGGNENEPGTERFKACSQDSECILVKNVGCCGCDTAINTAYQIEWQDMLDSQELDCDEIQCSTCFKPAKAICHNNVCVPSG